MRDFDPRHRIAFAALVLFLLILIAVIHGRVSLVMVEVAIFGLAAVVWVGGTGVQDFLKQRREAAEASAKEAPEE
ncbi:MAG: hypothetical protein AAF763_13920 [Pseudomonadota bacterium]